MWGDNMLVAPKIGEPESLSIGQNGIYNYQVYLPPSSDWYFYDTKQLLDFTSYGY